jgi:ribosome biogenesis GTPase
VVANITQLVVVVAPVPRPDFFVIDRYLCAATAAGIRGALAVNKCDLGLGEELPAELQAYEGAGYPQVRASLLPGEEIATGELVRDEEGRHTTTSSRAYELPSDDAAGAARLIDSPGVRDFAPAIDSFDEKTLGFPEVAQRAHQCRFLDCKHLQEPGCAVLAAVQSHQMAARRYESYRRLRRLFSDLVEARGPGPRKRR